jgi:hypothetical protein
MMSLAGISFLWMGLMFTVLLAINGVILTPWIGWVLFGVLFLKFFGFVAGLFYKPNKSEMAKIEAAQRYGLRSQQEQFQNEGLIKTRKTARESSIDDTIALSKSGVRATEGNVWSGILEFLLKTVNVFSRMLFFIILPQFSLLLGHRLTALFSNKRHVSKLINQDIYETSHPLPDFLVTNDKIVHATSKRVIGLFMWTLGIGGMLIGLAFLAIKLTRVL